VISPHRRRIRQLLDTQGSCGITAIPEVGYDQEHRPRKRTFWLRPARSQVSQELASRSEGGTVRSWFVRGEGPARWVSSG